MKVESRRPSSFVTRNSNACPSVTCMLTFLDVDPCFSDLAMTAHVERVVIVGAGSSSSTPMLSCLLSSNPCPQCSEAAELGYNSPNHRLNPSLLVQIRDNEQQLRNVVIDVTKTFRESCIKVLRPLQVNAIHAVLLTHDHTDACWGIDDLREFTLDGPVDVYCDERTMDRVSACYPYLMGGPQQSWVAAINWRAMPPTALHLFGLPFVRLLVEHGEDYHCNAFAFHTDEGPVVYMSDVSSVPQETQDIIDGLQPISILVLDMMSRKPHSTHFNYDASVAYAARLRAERVLFVGLSHSMSYTAINDLLAERLPHAKVARDGEKIYVHKGES